MKIISKTDTLAGAILIAGALNWGLVSLTRRDAVAAGLGRKSPAARGIYGLVGVSALYHLARHFGPKTKRERLHEQADQALDEIEKYQGKLQRYLKTANRTFDQGVKTFKKVSASRAAA